MTTTAVYGRELDEYVSALNTETRDTANALLSGGYWPLGAWLVGRDWAGDFCSFELDSLDLRVWIRIDFSRAEPPLITWSLMPWGRLKSWNRTCVRLGSGGDAPTLGEALQVMETAAVRLIRSGGQPTARLNSRQYEAALSLASSD